jgi:Domain of unknown function (DUF4209)
MNSSNDTLNFVFEEKDLTECGLESILKSCSREGYASMWAALSSASDDAVASGRTKCGKTLKLLANACSMTLSPESANEPFKPMLVLEGRRSTIPEDFVETDVEYFSNCVDHVDNIWLRARLSDIVWLLKFPRDAQYALIAIDSYRSIPLTKEVWIGGGKNCWERAMRLARLIGKGGGQRLQEMQEEIISAFNGSSSEEGFFAYWMAELLRKLNLGLDFSTEIALKLEVLATEFNARNEQHKTREYYHAAIEWFKLDKNTAKSTELTATLAECYANEVGISATNEKRRALVGVTDIEKAIQIYRQIPKAERAKHNVEERINELRGLLKEYGESTLDDMGKISLPGLDLTESVKQAKASVSGKSAFEALKVFSNLHPWIRYEDLKNDTLRNIEQFPMQSIIGGTFFSKEGRVIAKRPGLDFGKSSIADNEVVVFSEMVKAYRLIMGSVVYGMILPALEVLHLEHRLLPASFLPITSQSPIIPPGREKLVAMGLFYGYDNDFISAIHLLVPQIEHIVRMQFKIRGIKTTSLDSNGIETENGLSTLVDHPDMNTVFGDDLTFEIKSLFCSSFGSNLRNEVAHGLLDYQSCQSYEVVYACWFCLKIVFNNYLLLLESSEVNQDHKSEN